MKPQTRFQMEQDSRKWALENYGIEINGKKIENFIDEQTVLDEEIFNFSNNKNNPNPHAIVSDNLDHKEWVKSLYKLILDRDVTDQDDGLNHWLKKIEEKIPKEHIENYFRQVAKEELNKNNTINFEDILDKNDKGKRILMVMPKSAGDVFWTTSLFKSIKNLYPDYNLYYATQKEYMDILDGNQYIHKVIEYNSVMDNLLWSEGYGEHEGYFEITFLPYIGTQKILNYLHNGKDKLDFQIKNF
jgi:hypothetical protein